MYEIMSNRLRTMYCVLPNAVSSGLLCNHDGALPHETVRHRRAGSEGSKSPFARRPPNATRLEAALHTRPLDTSEATDAVNGTKEVLITQYAIRSTQHVIGKG